MEVSKKALDFYLYACYTHAQRENAMKRRVRNGEVTQRVPEAEKGRAERYRKMVLELMV